MPEPETSPGFFDRNFGSILTAVGVLGAAALAGNSGFFKDNNPPVPEIVIGETNLLAATAANQPRALVIPADYSLSLFSGKSGDPDSKLKGTTLNWMLSGPTSSQQKSCPAEDASCRAYTIPRLTPGLYSVSLIVTDGQSCGYIRVRIDDLGCERSAADAIVVRVVPNVDPQVVLQPSPTTLDPVVPLKLDATMSTSYDGSLPSLEWLIEGVQFARNVSTVTIDPRRLALPNGATEISVSVVARDRLSRVSKPTVRRLAVTRPTVVTFTRPTVDVSPSAGVGAAIGKKGIPPVCLGGASYALQTPLTVELDGECVLPRELITNGMLLSLDVRSLRSEGSVVRAFPLTSAFEQQGEARSGNPGAHGLSPGADGLPGGAGENGVAGARGRDAATITIKGKTFSGDMTIINVGQAGSDGVRGGNGGNGGNGAQGESAASGVFDCRRGPGRGGNGGAGGAGGSGGQSGPGGAGGNVLVDLAGAESGSAIDVSTVGGASGQPGAGGRGGQGGQAGPEGATSGLCGSAGRFGYPGPNGVDGLPGEAAVIGIDAPISVLIGGKEQQRGNGTVSLKVL